MSRKLFAADKVDWKAVWIWHEDDPHEKNLYVYLRRTFNTDRIPEESMLHITADSEYRLWVNSKEIGRGPILSEPRWQSYDSYDVNQMLQEGENVIAVLCYYYGGAEESKRTIHDSIPGMLCQLEMQTNGEQSLVISDNSWKSLLADCWLRDSVKLDDVTYTETYLAAREVGNWKDACYDDSSWKGVIVRTGLLGGLMGDGFQRVHAHIYPWMMLEPRDVPHLDKRDIYPKSVIAFGEIMEREVIVLNESAAWRMAFEDAIDSEFTSIESLETLIANRKAEIIPFDMNTSPDDFKGIRSATVVLDMGELMNGRAYLDVEGPAGGIIDIAYAQRLRENGKPEIYGRRIASADRYVMKEGRQQWTSFGWRHFRYIQITFRNLSVPLVIHDIRAVADEHPLKLLGKFNCSDEFLNWLWQAEVRTVRLSAHDQLMAAMNRERRQCNYDQADYIPTLIAAFGDVPIMYAFFRNMLRAQSIYGCLLHTLQNKYEWGQLLFGSGESVIEMLWRHFEFFGDRELLKKAQIPLRRHMEFMRNFRGKDGLICDHPLITFQDWAEVDGDGKGKILTENVRHAYGLQMAGWIAREIGDEDLSQQCLEQFRQTVDSINSKFWDDTRGVYVDYITPDDKLCEHVSEHGNYMLMAFGYVSKERAEKMVAHLEDPGPVIGQVASGQMAFLVNGLFNYGYAEYAMKVMRHRYGRMRNAGLDTLSETWNLNGVRTWGTGWRVVSFRSVAVASSPPVYGPARWILGVHPLTPGGERVEIAPQIGDLQWAEGSVPTSRGLIDVLWKMETDKFRIECAFPDCTEGSIVLPFKVGELESVSVNGREIASLNPDKDESFALSGVGRMVVEAVIAS